jgi:hypothetical protein
MHRISVDRYRRNRPAYIRHCGITLALLAALMNAFFHNSGVFSPDLMTSCLIGLLIADYRLALRDVPRQAPVDEAEGEGEQPAAGARPDPRRPDQSSRHRLAPSPVR